MKTELGRMLSAGNQTLEQFVRGWISRGFDYTRLERDCTAISDRDYAYLGIQRVLSQCKSGRDWLQGLAEDGDMPTVKRSTFFAALGSPRRSEMIGQVAEGMATCLDRLLPREGINYLADFPELNDYEFFSGDGHTIEHASHAEKLEGKAVPASMIYQLNMRTGVARALTPVSGDGKRKHEMPVLRSALLDWDWRRGSSRKGCVEVYDRAAVDNQFWTCVARQRSLYVICRMKENMKPEFRIPQEFDSQDPVNKGITGFFLSGLNNAGTIYEVEYQDPETKQQYSFFTTLPQGIRPGVIAWLYFLRWRIEKTFDNFENDFEENKEWGGSRNAQIAHAAFVVMAYNVSRALLAFLRREHNLTDTKVEQKYSAALDRREKAAAATGRTINPLHRTTLPNRMPKLSLQFIRSLRNHIFSPKTLSALVPLFAAGLRAYL